MRNRRRERAETRGAGSNSMPCGFCAAGPKTCGHPGCAKNGIVTDVGETSSTPLHRKRTWAPRISNFSHSRSSGCFRVTGKYDPHPCDRSTRVTSMKYLKHIHRTYPPNVLSCIAVLLGVPQVVRLAGLSSVGRREGPEVLTLENLGLPFRALLTYLRRYGRTYC